ncbi:Cytoplasmic GTPase/eEF2-like protein (ribosomal biogenesis), partial [Tulasnella sp. 408]
MEDDMRWRDERERRLKERKERGADEGESAAASNTEDGIDEAFKEKDDEDLYFLPDRGNVLFASAIDGWAFRVGKFAQLYAAKLGVKEANLRRVLWGDFYLDPKTKRVISHKHLKGRNLKPLFVQFVLDNIWAVYQNVVIEPNPDKVTKIVDTLGLKIPPRDLKSKDTRYLLSLIFSQWLSLSTATFQAVVEVVPPPSIAQRQRIPKMLYPDLSYDATTDIQPKNKLEEDLYSCDDGPNATIIAYVSKMFAVKKKEMPENKRKVLTAEEMRAAGRAAREARAAAAAAGATSAEAASVPLEVPADGTAAPDEKAEGEGEEEVLLGFARLYSGTISRGTKLFCVLPKYNSSLLPSHSSNVKHLAVVDVASLYVMMGRELVPVESVKAGNVFAVAGLAGIVGRNATICGPGLGLGRTVDLQQADAEKGCLVNLAGISGQAAPIVRVALEPENP